MSENLQFQEFRPAEEPPRRRRLPVWVWPAAAVIVIALVGGLVLLLSQLGRPGSPGGAVSGTLSAANPSIYHPDGLIVTLVEGSPDAGVTLSTTPRDALAGGSVPEALANAYSALIPGLAPLSPVYSIDVSGEATLVAEMAVPGGTSVLERLDLYRWDAGTGAWVFIPSQLDRARQVVTFRPGGASTHVMAFESAATSPVAGVLVTPGGPALDAAVGLALVEGVAIDETGALTGAPAEASAATVLAVVENRAGDLPDYTAAPPELADRLVELAGPYAGLALDFDTRAGYGEYVAALAERLHAAGKQLHLILRTSDFAGLDVAAAGGVADRVWVSPAYDPAAYLSGNTVEQMMDRLVGQVERRKLGLLVSALHVDVADAGSTLVSFEQAVEPLGSVQVAEGYLTEGAAIPGGSFLPLRLDGSVESLGYDPALKMNFLTYRDADGMVHHVYFASAANLQQRLDLARRYALAGAAVHGLAHPDAPEGLAGNLPAFLAEQPVAEPEPLEIVWQVQDASGAALSEDRGDLSLVQYFWEASVGPGQYRISALLNAASQTSQRGEISVEVGEGGAAARPTATTGVTPAPTRDANATATPRPSPTPTVGPDDDGAPPPVVAPGVGGGFELGGQVPGVIAHPNEMRTAGMSWVKYQIKWSPGADPSGAGGYIGQGHANGFKVLLSITGPLYPTSIDYNGYVEYLRSVAGYGPDGIEVWNEMNLNREWPSGQIDPANYVNNMLAPAFNAIKSVSPGTMVIIGALAPTGVDDGVNVWSDQRYVQGLASAGAARYADCIGVHHNAGATSPAASTGHPAGGHYSWYFQPTISVYYGGIGGAMPVCFTEFGYVSGEGLGELPANWSWGSAITVADQAAWLAEGVRIGRSLGYVRLMIIWNVDFTYWGDDPQAGYAIVRPDGSCPACGPLGAAMQ